VTGDPTPAQLRAIAERFREQIGGVYCYVAAALDYQAAQREELGQ
jgi:hypothetical protein